MRHIVCFSIFLSFNVPAHPENINNQPINQSINQPTMIGFLLFWILIGFGLAIPIFRPTPTHSHSSKRGLFDGGGGGGGGKGEGVNGLEGCSATVFMVNTTIGGQEFALIVDTGSSTLGVASTQCTTCGNLVTPRYAFTGQNQHVSAAAQYGDGSGWAGTIYTDSVQLQGNGVTVSGFPLVAIESQSNGFFDQSLCEQDQAPVAFQGILGLGYDALASAATKSFAQTIHKPFRIQMCDFVGDLTFDPPTLDKTATFDPPTLDNIATFDDTAIWLPVTKPRFHAVQLENITVVGSGLTVIVDVGEVILDTGSSLTTLKPATYTALVNALNADVRWTDVFGIEFWPNAAGQHHYYCWPMKAGWTVSMAAAHLPNVGFSFRDIDGQCRELRLPALRTLARPIFAHDDVTVWCPGILIGDPQIMGWTFLNHFATTFDLSSQRVALAINSHSPCDHDLLNDSSTITYTPPIPLDPSLVQHECQQSQQPMPQTSKAVQRIISLWTNYLLMQIVILTLGFVPNYVNELW
jgi:hypothetical protein